jgi:hypothetical protein
MAGIMPGLRPVSRDSHSDLAAAFAITGITVSRGQFVATGVRADSEHWLALGDRNAIGNAAAIDAQLME